MRYDRRGAAVTGLDVAGRQVVQVEVVINPDKLLSWNEAAARPGRRRGPSARTQHTQVGKNWLLRAMPA